MTTPRIRVIGAGGIGLCLLPTLCRFLNYGSEKFSFSNPELWIADGDNYEIKNAARQRFTRSDNKAVETAKLIIAEYPKIDARAFPNYVTEENVASIVQENDIIFSCVDNHATRRMLSEYCGSMDNVVLISGGNEYTDGNIQVYVRKNRRDITLPLNSKYHPEIASPPDENPGQATGCAALAPSSPKLLITNNFVAALMLNAFYAVLTNNLAYDEAFADVVSNKVKPVQRTPNVKVEVVR